MFSPSTRMWYFSRNRRCSSSVRSRIKRGGLQLQHVNVNVCRGLSSSKSRTMSSWARCTARLLLARGRKPAFVCSLLRQESLHPVLPPSPLLSSLRLRVLSQRIQQRRANDDAPSAAFLSCTSWASMSRVRSFLAFSLRLSSSLSSSSFSSCSSC